MEIFFYHDILTANIWIKDIDCVSFDEYKRLYNFISNELISCSAGTKDKSKLLRICLVSNVLLNSRFTRNPKVYKLPSDLNIVFTEIYVLYFRVYMRGSNSRDFKTILTLDSYAYPMLKSLYHRYVGNLSAFYRKYDISTSLIGCVFLDCNMISKIKVMNSKERQLFLHKRGWFKGDNVKKSDRMDVTDILNTYGHKKYHSPIEKPPVIALNTLRYNKKIT